MPHSELDQHLVLTKFIYSLFGKESFSEFRQILKDATEGFDDDGYSFAFRILMAQPNLRIDIDKLEEFDHHIRSYVDKINKKRDKKITLKYFQYLAVLFNEIYLDKYFSDPIAFLNQINTFLEDYIESNMQIEEDAVEYYFSEDELRKLAFWMATGSGKSHIMEINYLQFLRYNKGRFQIEFNKILLITPSETLSTQHFKDLQLSNIPSTIFKNNNQGYFSSSSNKDLINIIDIHKLVEEKKGEGVTVEVERFGKNNILFVDEGHKGSSGFSWRELRRKLSEEGFTFEYSATFGQAISSASQDGKQMLQEYRKSILFDYSYRHFYKDGYGKEYQILNLKDEKYSDNTKNTLLLANLLTFYEQKIIYNTHREKMKVYNLEEPLWIFVGSRVKGKNQRSDIRNVVIFLQKVLKNKSNWVIKTIKKILEGNSGLIDEKQRDLFSPSYPDKRLSYLRNSGYSPQEIYEDVLEKIFHCGSSVSLHLVNLKNASGEIALKAGNSQFFGLINIGDDRDFLRETKKEMEITVDSDEITHSLFDDINKSDSEINILIGAKKFIEGWNSWRVSNMGLLNIGRSEGPQIIQLFGRGVRLRGKGFSLKRSTRIKDNNPESYIPIMERLNIFGIEANYMDKFRDYLNKERIETVRKIDLPKIPIQIEDNFLEKDLLLPDTNSDTFKDNVFIELELDRNISVTTNLLPRVEIIESEENEGIQATTPRKPQKISDDFLRLLDWDEIYIDLLRFKGESGWNNIRITKSTLIEIMEKQLYTLYCPSEYVHPSSFKDIIHLNEITKTILKKYLKRFYEKRKNNWLKNHMDLITLRKENDNLNFENYDIQVDEDKPLIYSEVKQIIEEQINQITEKFSSNYLENVFFDNHIYQPLLSDNQDLYIHPAGLNEGEKQFIYDLKEYFGQIHERIKDKEIYVLRNLPKRGIGFFKKNYFYPDFIIWIVNDQKQSLLFVDPKGMSHMWEGLDEEKILLYKDLEDIQEGIRERKQVDITLDSFIISINYYDEIKQIFNNKTRKTLEEHHILFQKDDQTGYIEKMLKEYIE